MTSNSITHNSTTDKRNSWRRYPWPCRSRT